MDGSRTEATLAVDVGGTHMRVALVSADGKVILRQERATPHHADVPGALTEPGCRLSYQRHTRRAEHWFVVAGSAEVTLDGVVQTLGSGDAIDIHQEAAHRIANTGTEALMFIEVQHGDYFGEDDIERLEDDFGHAG